MLLQDFMNDESGAITVDWVILTSAIVGISIAMLIIIASGIGTAANATDDELENTSSVAGLISDTAPVCDAHAEHHCE